ncbi:MAG: RDD family protein [Bacteroidota bacterium]
MKRNITKISRTLTRIQKDKNSEGQWVENEFSYKYLEPLPHTSIPKRILHRCIDLFFIQLFFATSIFSVILLFALIGESAKYFFINLHISDFVLGFIIILYYLSCSFFYYSIVEIVFGRTIGHMITGSIVVNEYGEKPNVSKILLRSLARYTPLDSISAFEKRALHDQFSETLVLNKKGFDAFLLKLEMELLDVENKM